MMVGSLSNGSTVGGRFSREVSSFLLPLIQVLIVLLVYPFLHSLYFNVSSLPEKAYFGPVFAPQIFNQPFSLLIWLFILTAVLLAGYKRLAWEKFEQGQNLRYFIVVLSLVITWAFATYDYNLYYDQPHYIDRFLLILLTLLIWLNPIFIPFFLIQAIMIVSQFNYPFGSYSWTDKRILFDILILFNIALYLKLLFRRQISRVFLFLALCLFAANYFISGLEKLSLDWVGEDRIDYLIVSAYANGWLIFLPERILLNIVDILRGFNFFFVFMTMIIEVGALIILLHKKVAFFLLPGFILLHGVIFITTGIFFWKWIILAAAFIFLLKRIDEEAKKQLFSKTSFLASLFIIYLSPNIFDPAKLAWYDTNLNNFYEIEVMGKTGTIYQVGRSFMSPYDFPFAQNRFWYLSNEKLLVGTYGSTSNVEIARALETVTPGEALTQLETSQGQNYYDEKKAKRFEYFLQTYFENLNRRQSKTIFINYLAAPHHIWNFTQGNRYQLQEQVQEVRIRFVKTLYDGEKIHIVKDDLLRVLGIPAKQQLTFERQLTFLGCDIYLDIDNHGKKNLVINSYWRAEADLQPDFDIRFRLRNAASDQVVGEWLLPYIPDSQDSWEFGQVVNVVHQLDGEGKFDEHYHLDIALLRRPSDPLKRLEINESPGSDFVRIENIQDKIIVRKR